MQQILSFWEYYAAYVLNYCHDEIIYLPWTKLPIALSFSLYGVKLNIWVTENDGAGYLITNRYTAQNRFSCILFDILNQH